MPQQSDSLHFLRDRAKSLTRKLVLLLPVFPQCNMKKDKRQHRCKAHRQIQRGGSGSSA